jgi:hypothetical protein
MTKIKLVLLTMCSVLFLGVGNGYAQSSSVVITVTLELRKISVQVIDAENKITRQEFKNSEETPPQLYLKQEMDKWILAGYNVTDSYGFGVSSQAGATAVHQYIETVILTKKD